VLARSPHGKVLYTRRRAWPPGAWGLVAGFVEIGETAEAAATREVEEESGLRARQPRLLRTITHGENLLICVAVEIDDGSPTPGSDVDEVRLCVPDPALTPEGWPARSVVESYALSRSS
jgi:ADP-ribose pyrophosphatase YjhB (NUDIX family)